MDLKRWRQIGTRILSMDRAELHDRLRQEFASRQDVLLARIGHDFGSNKRAQTSLRGNFFFTQDSINSILTLIRQRLPGQVERIVQQAEKICQHHFDLLGYSDLDYGRPIDWHRDAVHGKRAPRKPFYKIQYLDYDEVGDSKVTWELNRHQHLVTLAKAHRLTGDRRYADETWRQWRNWWAENPYPVGINWASSLEVAFRSLSWIWTYYLLQGSAGVPDLQNEWHRGLALHGRHIERHLSTYFSPNTHLLGEGVALFFLGVLCPDLKAAERWKSLGWKIVLQEAERQVRSDGFHFEQSSYYHVYALDFFMHSAVLASANGIPTPKSFEDTIEKMLTALSLLGRGGAVPRFGDDDGGRLFDPRRNRGEHLLDPLATGAILFNRGEYKKSAGGLREETLWLLGAEGVRQWDDLDEVSVPHKPEALVEAGFYLLPADDNTQLVVDAGPLGTQSGGHGHADALSVGLQSEDHWLLIDPGTYEYVGPGNDRNIFRGTAMHNTLRVDGVDQAEPATPFSWRRLTRSWVEQWIQGKSFDLLVASHDGYHRLEPPVTHRRLVLSLRNGIYLVRDIVEGRGTHRIDIAWHLGDNLQLGEDNRFRVKNSSQGLAILPVQEHGWSQELYQESWSPAYGEKAPMPVMKFSAEVALPAEFAVLLVTLNETRRAAGCFTRITDGVADPELRSYKYSGEGSEYSLIFGKPGKSWQSDSLSSDAEFACWKKNPTSEQLMFSRGSFAQVEGGAQLRCSRIVDWAELVVGEDGASVFSSDQVAIVEQPTGMPRPGTASRILE